MNEENDMLPKDHDPHVSKIDPDDPRLRIRRPAGRSLKKGPVIAIIAVLSGALLLAVTLALLPTKQQEKVKEEQPVAYGQNTIPDFIRNAPDNDDPVRMPADPVITAPVPDSVPQLGRKLPGDLGATMVSSPGRSGSYSGGQKSPEEQAYESALASGPFFSGPAGTSGLSPQGIMTAQQGGPMLDGYARRLESAAQAASMPGLFTPPDPNRQDRKNDFLDGTDQQRTTSVSGMMTPPASPYEVKAGAIIPVTLLTGINSDLPGDIIGQVRENVYDTVSGEYLLIPQGSRLMASYDSMVSYGQKRVLVCWNRLIRPDGSSVSLECMPGVDLEGYAGFHDRVDNHYDRLIGGVILSSVLSLGATTSQGEWNGYDDMNAAQMFAANAGGEISNAGDKVTSRNLDIQPTLKIRPGYSVNVLVHKDMIIPPYYQ
ncbi:conjugation TrbI family protein (plasmid) [Prosthecochloris aestuarii DSM 271]|uniref:Conjugation TrbI family protein n=1 Tax=Prosthecochloris aestuarii (strain DSM 271 / SK 413) TaxID=290512 RepID=B4S9L9_PROA2|nr:TrbI/VirB10 family protein [Prosthecochloris aestuarii]ACF47346.1 conjugation TrbI family protein [Prosthecochloris aestuarii DSM 271]